jgi:hypothetical protein
VAADRGATAGLEDRHPELAGGRRRVLAHEVLDMTATSASSTFGVLMIEGMSRDEILAALPEGFCDDCWQQALDRQKQFNTNPEKDYHDVFYVTHTWGWNVMP